jgi:uncharacterized protein YuzE
MKLFYYPDTDSLYVELNERASADSIEVAPGIVLDVDEQGNPVGIDIDRASLRVQLERIEMSELPVRHLVVQNP